MAAKIKDGLFIGDVDTSQDAEFLELNKISNLINLSGRESPNVWASHGLVYLTLNWEDRPDFVLFPERERNDILDDLCEFVDVSLQHGISVLMFSTRGEGRCVVASIAYLMCKYCWGLDKTMDYARSKKPDIELNRGFMQQLHKLDKHLQKLRLHLYGSLYTEYEESIKMRLKDWNPAYLDKPHPGSMLSGEVYDSKSLSIRSTGASNRKRRGGVGLYCDAEEEALLINSFVNSKQYISQLPGPYSHQETMSRKVNKLRFNPQEREYEHENRERPQRKAVIVGLLKGSRARHQAAAREQEEAKARQAQAQAAQQSRARFDNNRDSNLNDSNNALNGDNYSVDESAVDDNMSDVSDPVSPMGGMNSARNSHSNTGTDAVRSGSGGGNKKPSKQGQYSNPATLEDFPGSTASNVSVGSTDLYYFVGLGGAGTASANGSVSSNMPDPASQSQGSAQRGYGGSMGPGKGPSSTQHTQGPRDSMSLREGSTRASQGRDAMYEYSERDQRDAKATSQQMAPQPQSQLQPQRVARPASPSAAMQYQHQQQAAQGKGHPGVSPGTLRRQDFAPEAAPEEKPYRAQRAPVQGQQHGSDAKYSDTDREYSDRVDARGSRGAQSKEIRQYTQTNNMPRQAPARGTTPTRDPRDSRDPPAQYGSSNVADSMTLHELASMHVDPTPLRGKQNLAPSQSQSHRQSRGPSGSVQQAGPGAQGGGGGGGMAQFQSGGPVRVHRTGPSGGVPDRSQQRSAWNDNTQSAPVAVGARANTPTRTVPGRQFGNSDPQANFDATSAGGRAPPSFMSSTQRKASSSSINSGDDDGNSYSSDRNSRGPGDYNSLHNRVAPQRPNTTSAGGSTTQPRVYRHGSPAPNKTRQAPTGQSRTGQGSASMYTQRPSSA